MEDEIKICLCGDNTKNKDEVCDTCKLLEDIGDEEIEKENNTACPLCTDFDCERSCQK